MTYPLADSDSPQGDCGSIGHRDRSGGLTASALLFSIHFGTSAKAVDPPGQARWRLILNTPTVLKLGVFRESLRLQLEINFHVFLTVLVRFGSDRDRQRGLFVVLRRNVIRAFPRSLIASEFLVLIKFSRR